MRRTIRATILSAVAIAAALGLSGCGGHDKPSQPAAVETPPLTMPPTAPVAPSPAADPLPPPTALTDVMARLADPNIAGSEKVGLVEYATADDAAALDRFGRALRDGGFMPLSFEATDLTWSQSHQGNVVANVVIKPANRQAGRDFTFDVFPGADHFLIESAHGLTSEALRSDSYAAGLFGTLDRWLRARGL